MSTVIRVRAPEELKELVKRLNGVDRALAMGRASKMFSPELNRALIENSGGSGSFARGWVVSPTPGAIVVRNVFGKARWVEEKTKPHVILPKNRGGLAMFRQKVHKLFNPKKVPVGLVKGKKAKKAKKPKTVGARRIGIVGVLRWRGGGKRAFSAYKVNASTKAGAFVYAKEVHHPGTKGKYAFKKTMKVQATRLFSLLISEFKAALKGTP